MPGMMSAFGPEDSEKKNRFMEIFLPLLAGGIAAFVPGGGGAAAGVGQVLSGSFKRRQDDARDRMNETQLEALRADYDEQVGALQSEYERVTANGGFTPRPDWSPERNELARSQYNAKVNNLRARIDALKGTYGALMRNAVATGDTTAAIANFGRMLSDAASMRGIGDEISEGLARNAFEDVDEDRKLEERAQEMKARDEQIANAQASRRNEAEEATRRADAYKYSVGRRGAQERLDEAQIRATEALATQRERGGGEEDQALYDRGKELDKRWYDLKKEGYTDDQIREALEMSQDDIDALEYYRHRERGSGGTLKDEVSRKPGVK